MSLIGTHTLELDIHSNAYKTIGTCKQYNSAETISITCYDEDQVIKLSDVNNISMKIKTPDGKHYKLTTLNEWQLCTADDPAKIKKQFKDFNDEEKKNLKLIYPNVVDEDWFKLNDTSSLIHKDTKNNVITFQMPQSVFMKPGKVDAEVILESDGRLATMSFSITVIKSVYDEENVVSDAFSTDAVTELKNTISGYMNAALGAKNDAKDYSLKSESYAVGTAKNDDGTDYREGQDVDNAKYYKEQAEEFADNANKSEKKCQDYYDKIGGNLKIKATLSSTNYLPESANYGDAYFIDDGSGTSFEYQGDFWPMGTMMVWTTENNWALTTLGGSGGGGSTVTISKDEPLGQPKDSLWYQPYE